MRTHELWYTYLCRKLSRELVHLASNSELVEVEGLQLANPAVRGHQLARSKLSGAARWKLKKTRAGESGTGAQVLVPANNGY